MIRETYKGRQLKAIKGKSYGKSRISVNGSECGEWLGGQADVIEWAKRTIDDVDSRPFEGRWAECWYAPGTYELNEHGHAVAPGGTCSCDYCERRRIQPCANITAGGVCVCSHCMKPYLADDKKEEAVDIKPSEQVEDQARSYVGCWTCSQPATYVLTREGSNTLHACDNCTRIDRTEAETRGWAVQPIGGGHSTANVEPGVRVSGEVGGQSFTGTVRTIGRRGGRCAIAADGKFTRIELGELESVVVATDNELTMPSGRMVRSAHLTGEALDSLRAL